MDKNIVFTGLLFIGFLIGTWICSRNKTGCNMIGLIALFSMITFISIGIFIVYNIVV
jgi:hypothetical protein